MPFCPVDCLDRRYLKFFCEFLDVWGVEGSSCIMKIWEMVSNKAGYCRFSVTFSLISFNFFRALTNSFVSLGFFQNIFLVCENTVSRYSMSRLLFCFVRWRGRRIRRIWRDNQQIFSGLKQKWRARNATKSPVPPSPPPTVKKPIAKTVKNIAIAQKKKITVQKRTINKQSIFSLFSEISMKFFGKFFYWQRKPLHELLSQILWLCQKSCTKKKNEALASKVWIYKENLHTF